MPTSILGKVLTYFEASTGPISVLALARELEISPYQLESMIQHWILKGRLRPALAPQDCGTCGKNNNCPFIVELPRSYEIVPSVEPILEELPVVPCHNAACGCS